MISEIFLVLTILFRNLINLNLILFKQCFRGSILYTFKLSTEQKTIDVTEMMSFCLFIYYTAVVITCVCTCLLWFIYSKRQCFESWSKTYFHFVSSLVVVLALSRYYLIILLFYYYYYSICRKYVQKGVLFGCPLQIVLKIIWRVLNSNSIQEILCGHIVDFITRTFWTIRSMKSIYFRQFHHFTLP